MFACCNQEPETVKEESTIATAATAASSEVPPAEEPAPPPVEEKAPEPAPVVEEPPAAAAAGPVVLKLDRTDGAALGVLLDKTDPKNLVLLKVNDDGLVKKVNDEVKQGVKAGFRVVKVNGTAAAAADMVTMIQQKVPLEIEFEPFEEKKVKLEKGDKKLGIALGVGKDGTWITINKLETEGAVPEWNATAAPEQKVMVCDKIVRIDGVEGKAEEMVQWIKDKTSMELTVYSWKSLQA
eukprot:TRINITY_DN8333_c0_g4_i1.p1 TRINITY_DN8333_c0_g4~~TRINITY_DN8333_c0_g4_i1.p1  ORF type:complete len:238 (+),score=87.46 TRINITY_DN8333_c0_g4_i1:76-789(+)